MTSSNATDACFAEANLNHGVEFVSSLYLSRLEAQQQDAEPKRQLHDAKRFFGGAVFLDRGGASDSSSNSKKREDNNIVIFSSASAFNMKPSTGQNVRWALERVVAVPSDADASKWLADVNRCAIRLASSFGRSTLPRLAGAVPPSVRPLSICPVVAPEDRQQQQQQHSFDYLILRETIAPPASSRLHRFFESLPESETQRAPAEAGGAPSVSSPPSSSSSVACINVKRVSLLGVSERAESPASATASPSIFFASDVEKERRRRESTDENDTGFVGSERKYDRRVALSVSSASALFAPANHNEHPYRMDRSWLGTRVALSSAPLYSFLGGIALNIDGLELESQQQQQQQDEEESLSSSSSLTAVAKHRNDPLKRIITAEKGRHRQHDDHANNAASDDDDVRDPFDRRPLARAAVELDGRLTFEAADETVSEEDDRQQRHTRATALATRELTNLHERIQHGHDAQFLRAVYERDTAQDRVLDKLAASQEYALCFDLLQDVDVDAARKQPSLLAHEIRLGDDKGIFTLSGMIQRKPGKHGDGGKQKVIDLFGLRSSSLAASPFSDSFFSQLLYDTVVTPLFGHVQLLHAAAFAEPVGPKNLMILGAVGHAVVNPAVAPQRASAWTSVPSSPVLAKLLAFLPRPWLVDVQSRKTRDPPHFLTAEIDAYCSGQCSLTFASAPQWSFYASYKDRSISQAPLFGGPTAASPGPYAAAVGFSSSSSSPSAAAAVVAAADAVVSPSPRLRSHQRMLEDDGKSAAQEVLHSSTPLKPAHHPHQHLPPLSPTPAKAAHDGVPLAAVHSPPNRVGFVTPQRSNPRNATLNNSNSQNRNEAARTEQHAAHHSLPAASSAFSPMSYTSRITASTRRHFDGQFLSSPRGFAHKKQQDAAENPNPDINNNNNNKTTHHHVADGRTVEIGANYHYCWNREWEVDWETSQQQLQPEQQLSSSCADSTPSDDEGNNPMPAFWDRIEFKGVLSLLYGLARRAGDLENDVAEFHEREEMNRRLMTPLFSPGRGAGGVGGEAAAAAAAGGASATIRTRQQERDVYRTYLGSSAVPPGDGSTRFYSVFNLSASWIAEKALLSTATMRLRGGCRWALATDPSAVPTLDEKNRADEAASLMMRGSPFLNHFFIAGQTAASMTRSSPDGSSGLYNQASQDRFNNRVSSNTCIHQPQGAVVLEIEKPLSQRLRSNIFFGATASCHLLTGHDYLTAINAEPLRGPNNFSQLFGAPIHVAPSVARAAESRAKGSENYYAGSASISEMMRMLVSPPDSSSSSAAAAASASSSALSRFSLATNLRALAEVVAGVSFSWDFSSHADGVGEKLLATKDLGQRMEMSWWWPLISVDSLRARPSSGMGSSSSSAADSSAAAALSNFFRNTPATYRYGLSLHL